MRENCIIVIENNDGPSVELFNVFGDLSTLNGYDEKILDFIEKSSEDTNSYDGFSDYLYSGINQIKSTPSITRGRINVKKGSITLDTDEFVYNNVYVINLTDKSYDLKIMERYNSNKIVEFYISKNKFYCIENDIIIRYDSPRREFVLKSLNDI